MKNRWKASVTNEEAGSEESATAQPKNNSKKIGIAMGIVGALLVTAGVVPMFMGSDNLEGDLTAQNQAEEVDPLVALLSGGNSMDPVTTAVATPPVASPKATNPPKVSPKVNASVKPSATVKPVVTKPASGKITELDKILLEEGESVKENKNTGKKDVAGSAFGDATELHSAAGLSNTSNIKNSAKKQPTPKSTVQTGNNTSLVLGFLFLIIAGIVSFSGMLRRRR